jgi:hypothetical protein
MSIDYDWTCSVCGAFNAAGTTNCCLCGTSASNSAWSESYRWPSPSAAGNSILMWCGIAVGGGLFLARSFLDRIEWPIKTIPFAWYLGGGCITLAVIVLWAKGALQRRK